jgi:hypothetical protein
VCVAVAALTAACSAATSSSPSRSQQTAKLSDPASSTSPRVRLAACRAHQLTAAVLDSGAGAGTSVYRVDFTNRGRKCVLTGHPAALLGIAANGRDEKVRTNPFDATDAAYLRGQRPAVLSIHEIAEVVLTANQACEAGQQDPPAHSYRSLVVRLAHHRGQVHARVIGAPEPQDVSVNLPCRVNMSGFSAMRSS